MAGPNDTCIHNIFDLEMDVPPWLNERMMMSLIPLEIPLRLGSMLLFLSYLLIIIGSQIEFNC